MKLHNLYWTVSHMFFDFDCGKLYKFSSQQNTRNGQFFKILCCEIANESSYYFFVKTSFCKLSMRKASRHCECAYESSYYFFVKTPCRKLSMRKASHLCEYANDHQDDCCLKTTYCKWSMRKASHLCVYANEH